MGTRAPTTAAIRRRYRRGPLLLESVAKISIAMMMLGHRHTRRCRSNAISRNRKNKIPSSKDGGNVLVGLPPLLLRQWTIDRVRRGTVLEKRKVCGSNPSTRQDSYC